MCRLLLALVLVVLSGDTLAANCPFTTGTLYWPAVGTTFGSCGAPTGADRFQVNGGSVVMTSTSAAPIAMTTGQIVVDGGTLLMYGPTKVSFSGSEAAEPYVHVKSGRLIATGYEVFRGRLVQEPTWSEGAGTETATLSFDSLIPTSWAPTTTTGAWVRFLDEDPADATASIEEPLLIGTAEPEGGKYRWSAAKWTWWPITAISGNTVTISTDAYGDIEGGTDTNIYGGTRGQALSSATALTSLVLLPHGQGTRLSVADSDLDLSVPGDLTDQYVEFVTGACAGWRARITDIVTQPAPTDDDIYIEGPAAHCGIASTIRINFGFRVHDLVQIAFVPEIDFANAATFRWSGGRVELDLANLEHLDDSEGTTFVSPSVAVACDVCVYRESATQEPDFANSHIRDSRFAHANTIPSADTGLLTFDSLDRTSAAFRHPSVGALDLQGMPIERNYFVDQWNNASGAGLHAIRLESANNLFAVRNRVTRMGDDAYYATMDSIGTGVGNTHTLRHFVAEALRPTTTNSQQGVNVLVSFRGTTPGASELPLHRVNVHDALLTGISDGAISVQTVGGNWERIFAGAGANSTGVQWAQNLSSAAAAGIIGTIPAEVRDLVFAMRGPSSVNRLILGGNLRDSTVYGNDLTVGSVFHMRNPVGIYGSFLDLSGNSSQPTAFFGRANNALAGISVPTIRIEQTALLGGRNIAGGAGAGFMKLCDDIDGGGVLTDVELDHVFIGARVNNQSSGFLTGCVGGEANAHCSDVALPYACCTGVGSGTCISDGGQTATIAGLTLALTNLSGNNGIGCASAPGSPACAAIDEGALVTNTRVEAPVTIARTSTRAFGANATDSSIHVGALGPDISDLATPAGSQATIAAFVDPTRDDMPHELGLSKLGTEQAMLGDAFLWGIGRFTTDARLIRLLCGSYGETTCEIDVDADGDTVGDMFDNCMQRANADQANTDLDPYGNACDPDYDGDGRVGIPDFNHLRAQFGKRSGVDADFDPDADHDGDGVIGLPDFNVLRSYFGGPPGPAGALP